VKLLNCAFYLFLKSNGTSVVQGLMIEIITTSVLTLSVYVLAVEERGAFLAAFGIGTSLLISVLVGKVL
jgi:glycerol uptake facilitator-like aquaporin